MHRPRSLLTTAALLTLAIANVSAAEPAPKPIRALLVCGGCCHDYDAQKTIIKDGLAERAHIEVTVVQQGGTTTDTRIPLYENPDWARGYDVVLHDECFSGVGDPEWTRRILKPHGDGLPGVVIHCAMHSYRDGTDQWFQFCGVTSRRHGKAYPHEVLNQDPTHPIMSNFGPAWANPAGELYWIEKVWPTAHPLAVSKNQEKGNEEVCVWTNQYEKARVFGTTIGHHNETVSSDEYLDLLTRGTLWACDKLNDQYLKPPKPRVSRLNHAKGQPATASSEQSGNQNFIANAFDGDSRTRWCAINGSKNQWLQVDLGKLLPLTGVRLEWEQSGTAYQFRVEGSPDGKTWNTLVDGSKNVKAGPRVVDFLPGEAQARYVRVTFLGSDSGGWGSLREVEVYGNETVVLEPEDPNRARRAAEAAALNQVKLPEGYEATVFATPPTVNYPVFVAAATNGDLYVSVDQNGSLDRAANRGAIARLRDLDGDGRADEVTRFVANVDSPRGLVWDHDRVYLMHPPHLSAFIDHDGDGKADEQKILVKNIAFTFKDRPADHTSNGVTLGIDGWLYLAIGDFGFMKAEGADGRKVQLRGGGVARVRPDGTGLEIISRGTRNILEVALDPLLNGFARDNTNDGGGWDIRLHHFSGLEHHGYPSLFQRFTDEAVQPLADYGGGSGCGSLFLAEPGFPNGDGHALYTADWGRSWVYRHHLTPNGATFTADQTEFLSVPRVTDLDVDGSSRLYVASWQGATFTYAGPNVGYILRLAPKGYTPEPLPDFARAKPAELVGLLKSPSHRRRLEAQRALLRLELGDTTVETLTQLAADRSAPIESRVAAVFTLKQGLNEQSTDTLVNLIKDESIREFAIRALTDRADQLTGVPADPILAALNDKNPRVRRQAVESLARLGNTAHASALTPLLADPDPIVAHTTVKALIMLDAVDACLAVVDRADAAEAARLGALRVLQSLHQPKVVEALSERLERETNPSRRQGLTAALCRLYFEEGPWNGDSWGTRPDTSGPYYQPETWIATKRVAAALNRVLHQAKGAELAALFDELNLHKIQLEGGLETVIDLAKKNASLVPAAIDQLARAETIPASALPILIQAAESTNLDDAARAKAVIALAKTNRDDTFQAIISALARIDPAGQDPRLAQQARSAFLNAPKLADHVELFEHLAQSNAAKGSVWADAALLVLTGANKGSPESRELANRAIDAAWNQPKRRAQLLRAVALANHRKSADKVLAALTDSDPLVASAAKTTAETLKLDTRPRGNQPTGPKIKDLTPEAVVAAVVKSQGNRDLGEQLFTRLNCANCHTVKTDEPLRGPFLGTVAATSKRPELAEAVLTPSKSIAQGFATNLFALDDGRTLTGFVVREAADQVTIRDADGVEIQIPTSSIDQRARQEVSVMPTGLADDLTVPEFSALLDFIESLAKK